MNQQTTKRRLVHLIPLSLLSSSPLPFPFLLILKETNLILVDSLAILENSLRCRLHKRTISSIDVMALLSRQLFGSTESFKRKIVLTLVRENEEPHHDSYRIQCLSEAL
jgi:hypothetical protein